MSDPNNLVEVVRAIRPSGEAALWIMAMSFAAAVIIAAVKISPAWVARMNERARDKAQERNEDWNRLREEIGRLAKRVGTLEETCDMLSRKVRECEAREISWMRRAIQAEAALMGQGEAKQEAARIVAVDRLMDKEDKKGTDK